MIGTPGDDKLSAGLYGVAFDADNDVDVTFAPHRRLPPSSSWAAGKNTLTARGGNGTGAVFTGSIVLRAGDLGDTLTGSNLGDLLGGGGNDDVNGYGGNDTIDGAGDDKLNGADGNDDSIGGLGADSISSGAGDDTIRAADGLVDPVLNGGAGIDTAYYDLIDPCRAPSRTRSSARRLRRLRRLAPGPGHDSAADDHRLGAAFVHHRNDRDLRPRLERGGLDLRVRPRPRRVPPLRLPVTYSSLALGAHQLRVRAIDPARERRSHACGALLDDRSGSASAPAASAGPGLLCLQRSAEDRDGHDPGGRHGDARGRRQRDSLRGRRLRQPRRPRTRMRSRSRAARGRSSAWSSTSRPVRLGRHGRGDRHGSEIELAVNLGDPTDQFVLGGTAGADLLSAGTKGVSFTPDTDLDVTFLPLPGAIELAGGAGNDTLTSGGGYGTAQAFLGRAILRGEGDDDALGGGASTT